MSPPLPVDQGAVSDTLEVVCTDHHIVMVPFMLGKAPTMC